MAWEARLGLKLFIVPILNEAYSWLNGLGSPFGIETPLLGNYAVFDFGAKWPGKPVWD